MKKIIKKAKKILKLVSRRASIIDFSPVSFEGWKMATGTRTPWLGGGGNSVASSFSNCDARVATLIKERKLRLSQFSSEAVDAEVACLKWRHYIVYWSVTHAIRFTSSEAKNLVELGVCDGLTAWYASSAQYDNGAKGKFFLYDAWEGMRDDLLVADEKKSAGSYSYLDVENTRSNLRQCAQQNFIFIKGYLPQSLEIGPNPDCLAWLHIDLNSAMPTVAGLDFFWPRMLSGGIVLLDDFAWPGYEETQAAVEKWASENGQNILHLPTGQGLIFKKEN